MAEDVQVTIGVALEGLKSGMEEAGESVHKLSEKFTHLGELIGISLTAAGFVEFIHSMAELGLQSERAAASLGVSLASVVELRGMALLTGSSLDAVALNIERMSLNVQKSTKDSINPLAQALGVLGLRAKDLIGADADQYFDKLMRAASRFNPSLNLTNALMEIGGRGAVNLAATLRLAGENYDEFKKKINEASGGMTEAIPKMADTHVKLTIMEMAVQSLGARIFTILKPAIDAAVVAITKWVEKLDISTLRQYALGLSDTLANAAIAAVGAFTALSGSLDQVLFKLKAIMIGAAIGGLAGGPAGAILGGLLGGSLAAFQTAVNAAGDGVDKGGDAIAKAIRDAQGKVRAALIPKYTVKDIAAALGGGHPSDLANAKGMDFGMAERSSAAMAAANEQIRINQLVFDDTKERLETSVKLFQTTEMQKTTALIDAIHDREQDDLEELNNAQRLMARHSKDWEEMERKKTEITQRAINDVTKANDDMFKKMSSAATSFADQLASSIGGQLRGLLSGAETFGEGMKNIFADMTLKIIEDLIRIMIQAMATNVALAIMAVLSGGASVASGSANTIASALPIPSLFPGHAAGTDYVSRTGLAMLHEGEAVVPADQNSTTGSGSAGVGGTVNLNVKAIDAASFASALMNNKGALTTVLRNIMRTNPGLLTQAARG